MSAPQYDGATLNWCSLDTSIAGEQYVGTDTLSLMRYPHPSRLKVGQSQVSLLSEIDIDNRKTELGQAEILGQDEYNKTLFRTVDEVAGIVHRTLRFYSGTVGRKGLLPPYAEELVDQQVADCYGHTQITSLCLENMNVDHSIVYANGHAAVAVFGKGDGVYFADAACPRLSQVLTPYLVKGHIQAVKEQLAASGKDSIVFLPDGFERQDANLLSGKYRYPWLDDPSGANASERQHLIMTAFRPDIGRKALSKHALYKRALGMDDLDLAAKCLLEMGAYYPELDVRVKHELKGVRNIVEHLCEQGAFEQALQVIEARFSAADSSKDARYAEEESRTKAAVAKRVAHSLGKLAVNSSELGEHMRLDLLVTLGRDACAGAIDCAMRAEERYLGSRSSRKPPVSYLQHIKGMVSELTQLSASFSDASQENVQQTSS